MQVVNGFLCQNCTDVDYAKKNIDPADPHGTKAAQKDALKPKMAGWPSNAVTFGGSLAGINPNEPSPAKPQAASAADQPRIDITA